MNIDFSSIINQLDADGPMLAFAGAAAAFALLCFLDFVGYRVAQFAAERYFGVRI